MPMVSRSKVRVMLTASVAWVFFYDVASYDIPTDFGCQNALIADDWRRSVLNFHNNMRRNLATGHVKTMNDAMAPMAFNMNELLWDCDIEKYASDVMCGAAEDKNYDSIKADLQNKKDCNITEKTNSLLKEWWSESTAIDLVKSQLYDADAEKNAPRFSHMANAAIKAFACTYGTCPGSNDLKLTCVYRKKLKLNDKIYSKTNFLGKVCTQCASKLPADKQCIKRLCQQEYTRGEELGDFHGFFFYHSIRNSINRRAQDILVVFHAFEETNF
ncbi:hypothetical protein Y032_0522g2882 [Ancylostoma ceylanicum]|uniref:SCP domain-containing protein n=2 Tax=Ancylostoma ceylanicum TaxID=53326 RepID=A0A016WS57_9BILA|nr:hypothetical protein Y032_0522g2882 [Ancylostoma ceylanicum]